MSLTAEQLASRQQGLGSSDAPVAAGLSPFKAPLRLYLEKRGELLPDEEETEAMLWGSVLEEPIADEYARRTGRKIRRQPLKISTRHPFMLANIDRQIVGDPHGPGILEVKSLNAFMRIQSIADIPDYIYVQGMHQLEVYGYDWISFAILLGGQKLVCLDLERDQKTIDVLVEVEGEFWRRVQLGDPPPPDGTEASKELLKQLYPRDSGQVITLNSDDALATVRALEQARVDLKNAEDRKAAHENWLKFRMGEASVARIPAYGEVTWKAVRESKEEVVDVPRLKAEFPAIAEKVITMQPRGGGRRFLLKPHKEKAS